MLKIEVTTAQEIIYQALLPKGHTIQWRLHSQFRESQSNTLLDILNTKRKQLCG